MPHPRKGSHRKPHDHPRMLAARRRKEARAARRLANGLANAIQGIR